MALASLIVFAFILGVALLVVSQKYREATRRVEILKSELTFTKRLLVKIHGPQEGAMWFNEADRKSEPECYVITDDEAVGVLRPLSNRRFYLN